MESLTLLLYGSVLLFVVFSVTFYRRPLLGLLTIVFLLPFERIGAYSLNPATGHPTVRLIQIASAALILGFGMRSIVDKKIGLRKIVQFRNLFLFAVSCLISAALVNYFRVWQIYLWLIFVMALFFLAAQLFTSKSLPKIVPILFVSTTLVSLFGIYQYLGDLAGLSPELTGLIPTYSKRILGFPRIQSVGLEPLYFANSLLLPIFVGLGILISQKAKIKPSAWIISSLVAINFILTMSRGAFIAAFGGGLVFIWLFRDHLRLFFKAYGKKLLFGTVLLFLVSFTALGLASAVSKGSFIEGPKTFLSFIVPEKVLNTTSFIERKAGQDLGIKVFRENPVMGVGLGGYAAYVMDYPAERRPYDWFITNNEFIELLAETGLVGFSFYLYFIFKIYRHGLKIFKDSKDPLLRGVLGGALSALTAILIQYNFFSGFFITHIWITLALIAGLSSLSVPTAFSLKKIPKLI